MGRENTIGRWKRLGKNIVPIIIPLVVVVLIINSFRYGLFGFIIVVVSLMVAAFIMNRDLIMTTAETVQLGLWGRHMTLLDLRGKKIKFVFGRGKKNAKKKSKKIHKRK